jgi:hypothetical protein
MISPDDRASAGKCDADPNCVHVPCFQVRLEASQPRQSNACAYHVADVIQALRAWAGQRTLVDGQLTILAIEPAAGGRQPGSPDQAGTDQAGTDQAGTDQPGGPDRIGLRGFAFSTIPLTPPHRRDPEASVGSPATPAERPEG